MKRLMMIARKFVEIQQIRNEIALEEANHALKRGLTHYKRVESWQECVYLLKRARALERWRKLFAYMENR